MDRLIATGSVNFAGRDVAPGSGTPQYATDGVPGVTPATIWPAYAWNMIQDEMRAVIVAAGLTPDGTNWTQLLQAISGGGVTGHGQCLLSVTSSTVLTLAPKNGRQIIIAGHGYSIPQAGITIANTGLTAATLYYVYAYNNSGTPALELSTTGHATDTASYNYGVEIKSGDNTRTLVGLIKTGAGTPGIFQVPTNILIACINWFNRKNLLLQASSIGGSTTSGAFQVMGSQINFLSWADEAISFVLTGGMYNTTISCGVNSSIAIDGSQSGSIGSLTSTSAGASAAAVGNVILVPTEGAHTAQAMIEAFTGGTAEIQGAVLSAILRG